ncbi:hypothetical protein [Actinoplanes sp. DH11]|uniref:hypothetical protein n=1 Tax=Actinoplanes sp. DH11 TaxID=2857011 RepID=UPI001E5D7DA0|nr:hypothetical protein [Actinoplanes sp. DH11]
MDLDAAVSFMSTHARVLERRRLLHLLGRATAADVVAALDGYRNADGGYGWALEPDLRSTTSQPVAAMHALEVLAEVGDTTDRGPRLLDWIAGHAGTDGGVPFALPFPDTGGCAPHWAAAGPGASLTMTAQLAAHAHRLARHRPDVAGHPWLAAATEFCLDAVEHTTEPPHAIELMFAMRFLDTVATDSPRARAALEKYVRFVRVDGPTPVAGGAEGEVLHPLDFTPEPGTPSREFFDAEAVAKDQERLAGEQQPDGGWTVTFTAFSPAATLEWRGYATVAAVAALRNTGSTAAAPATGPRRAT